jgi:hypothetical protein
VQTRQGASRPAGVAARRRERRVPPTRPTAHSVDELSPGLYRVDVHAGAACTDVAAACRWRCRVTYAELLSDVEGMGLLRALLALVRGEGPLTPWQKAKIASALPVLESMAVGGRALPPSDGPILTRMTHAVRWLRRWKTASKQNALPTVPTPSFRTVVGIVAAASRHDRARATLEMSWRESSPAVSFAPSPPLGWA